MKNWLFAMCLLMMMAGCSSSDDYDPTILPTKVTFSLVADDGVNPNLTGDTSPVEIQVFELKDDSMFMSADFDLIKADYKKALKSNFVEVYDFVLTPGQFKFISPFEIDEDTNYIGVMAHYSDIDQSEWKKAVKVINKGREYHLLMQFKDYDINLERVE